MFKRLISSAIIFGAAALAPPVLAQQTGCMPRVQLIESLKASYGEDLTGSGLQNPKQLLEIWSSGDSGSFTIFITNPAGLSCIVATGANWTKFAPPLGDVAG